MANGPDLRHIVSAMTERPWKRGVWQYDAGPPFRYTEIRPANDEDVSITVDGPAPSDVNSVKNVIGGCGCCGSPFGAAADGNAIVTLANHADAIVALVEACEAWKQALDTLHSATYPFGEYIDAEMKVASAATGIIAALAAVHAVRSEP